MTVGFYTPDPRLAPIGSLFRWTDFIELVSLAGGVQLAGFPDFVFIGIVLFGVA